MVHSGRRPSSETCSIVVVPVGIAVMLWAPTAATSIAAVTSNAIGFFSINLPYRRRLKRMEALRCE
jgi:hypothetical protein